MIENQLQKIRKILKRTEFPKSGDRKLVHYHLTAFMLNLFFPEIFQQQVIEWISREICKYFSCLLYYVDGTQYEKNIELITEL